MNNTAAYAYYIYHTYEMLQVATPVSSYRFEQWHKQEVDSDVSRPLTNR